MPTSRKSQIIARLLPYTRASSSAASSVRARATAIAFASLGHGCDGSKPAIAFDNGVPEMARFTNEKKSGKDIPLYTPNNKISLGLQDNGKLATCNAADDPNCFSTSGNSQKNLLEVWSPQAGGDAMGELLATIKAYPPGQNGACLSPGGSSSCVDGGGFLWKHRLQPRPVVSECLSSAPCPPAVAPSCV